MQDNSSLSTQAQTPSSASSWVASRWALLVLALTILLAGGGTGWWAWNRLASTPNTTDNGEVQQPDGTSSSSGTSNQAVAPIVTTTVEVYLLADNEINFSLVPVTLDVETADEPTAILDAAFDQLLDGDVSETTAFSTIPPGTTLLDVDVEDDGIYVDLSAEFEQGGGSASMTGRLAQVLYTATSLEPAEPVWLSVEGEPLELLGGEGLEVFQPMTRTEFDENFPL